MFNWYREWLQIRYEAQERALKLKQDLSVCQSCEVLKTALDRANYEKEQLLIRLTQKPEVVEKDPPVLTQLPPKNIPWRVRQQMLEAEDRAAAAALKKQKVESTAALEASMGIKNEIPGKE